MPEGHLVHHYAARHRAALAGRPLRVTSPQGRFAHESQRLDGCQLRGVDAIGKHLFYMFEPDTQVHVHLGQRGLFLEMSPDAEPPSGTRLRMQGDAVALHLIAPSVCELVDEPGRAAVVGGLGPDPLGEGPDRASAIGALAATSRPIGAVLLDQSVIAGIGNVLRSEILNLCRIDPRRAAADLTRDELHAVWDTTVTVMTRARDLGTIVTRGDAVPSDERDGRYVYKRITCARCGSPVAIEEIGGRAMYLCETCQRVTGRG